MSLCLYWDLNSIWSDPLIIVHSEQITGEYVLMAGLVIMYQYPALYRSYFQQNPSSYVMINFQVSRHKLQGLHHNDFSHNKANSFVNNFPCVVHQDQSFINVSLWWNLSQFLVFMLLDSGSKIGSYVNSYTSSTFQPNFISKL